MTPILGIVVSLGVTTLTVIVIPEEKVLDLKRVEIDTGRIGSCWRVRDDNYLVYYECSILKGYFSLLQFNESYFEG
jgi:hypothetical protein